LPAASARRRARPRSTIRSWWCATPRSRGKSTCPGPDKVVLVEPLYDANDESAPPVGWSLPLLARPTPEGATSGPLTADEARALGVTSIPKSVWIYHRGHPPCRGTVTDLTRDVDDAPGSMSIDARLEGCPPPRAEEIGPWFGLTVDAAPVECGLARAPVVAERVGDADGETWVRPAAETPIPAEIAGLVPRPKHACDAPDCEALWEVRAATVDGTAVAYEATLTWARPDEDLSLCELEHDDGHALFTVGKHGVTRIDEPADAWQHLVGVFYDATGPRQLLVRGRGTYTVTPFSPRGRLGAGVIHTWYVASTEEAGTWSLAQYCSQ
jgi:hypothetical protein